MSEPIKPTPIEHVKTAMELAERFNYWRDRALKYEQALREADTAFEAVLAEDAHGYFVAPMGHRLRQQAQAAHSATRAALDKPMEGE